MTTAPKTISSQYLKRKIRDLEARLEESEETLRAIRAGKVDADPGNSAELIQQLRKREEALRAANAALVKTEEMLRAQTNEIISSRKELERTQERYREVFDDAPDGYIVTDREGTIQDANAMAARLLGCSEAELKEVRLSNLLTTKEGSGVFLPLAAWTMGSIPVSHWVGEVFPQKGKPFWASITSAASRDNLGKILSLRWLIRDVTEHRQTEDSLRESEERHRLLSETMLQGVVYQNTDGKIISMNPAAERILGKSPEQFLGSSSVGEEHHTMREGGAPFPGLEHPAMVALRTGQPLSGVVMGVFNPKLNEYRWISIDAVPLFRIGENHPYQVYTVFEDITERKRAEATLREREERLKELNESLERQVEERTSELQKRALQLRQLAADLALSEQRERQRLAMVLHDGLQQILVAAKFSIALLERDEDVREQAAEISGLIDDCIETSRSLTAELSPPILYKGGLIPALEWLARWMRDKHGLTVRLVSHEPMERIPDEINILLFQSIRELLFNVAKHAGTKEAHVEVTHSEGRLELMVADNGAGFDPAYLESREEPYGGMGLFSINERLSYLGGKMEIDSAPGKGSRFRLITPVISSSELPPEKDAGLQMGVSVAVASQSQRDHDSTEKIRIILVDDHMVVRQGLAGLLGLEPDINVVGEASDGESAVNLVRRLHPDVILMDISMPGMDGIQASKIIHKEMPDVKIIGLSMFQEGEQAAAILKAGAVGYVTKSGPSTAVLEAIRACLKAKVCKAINTI